MDLLPAQHFIQGAVLLLGSHQARAVGAYALFEMQMSDKIHCTWLKQVRPSEVIPTCTGPKAIIMTEENKVAFTGFDLLFAGCTVRGDHYWSRRRKYE